MADVRHQILRADIADGGSIVEDEPEALGPRRRDELFQERPRPVNIVTISVLPVRLVDRRGRRGTLAGTW